MEFVLSLFVDHPRFFGALGKLFFVIVAFSAYFHLRFLIVSEKQK